MNTEPPTGDDLEQMLVAMKRTVLTRAAERRPQPRRRGRRAGIVIGVIAVLGIGATSGGVALGMIPQPFTAAPAPAPTLTEPAETPTRSSAPVVNEPTSTPTPTPRPAEIPTDCRAVVPETDYDRLFGTIPVRDVTNPEFGTDGFDLRISRRCLWMDPRADVSGIEVMLGTNTPEEIQSYLEGVIPNGFTCSERDGGQFCQSTFRADPYPVDTTTTFFARGTTWIEISQTNVPTNGLLTAVEQQVWG